MSKRKSLRSACWVLILVCCVGLLLGASADRVLFAEASAAEKPLRLHILANSDDPGDQKLKLELRDQVIWLLEEDMDQAATKDEALARLAERLPELTAACNAYLSNRCDYQAKLYIQRDDFPEIDYDGAVFSAGEYDALRIVLGKGAGHNWWCVLFPPLCFVDLAGEYSDDEALAVMADYDEYRQEGGWRISWKLKELWQSEGQGKEQRRSSD